MPLSSSSPSLPYLIEPPRNLKGLKNPKDDKNCNSSLAKVTQVYNSTV